MSVVPDKKSMYEMLRAGKFGNTARTWSSYQELLASGYNGLVGCRSKVPGGEFLAYQLAPPRGDYIYSEMQEDSGIVLQGEVYRSIEGLYLFASTLQTHMRVALKEAGKHYWLSAAYAQLEVALWPSDYDCRMWLLAE